MFKTRTLATDACEGGHVTVNDRGAKPSTPVKIGDRVIVRIEHVDRILEVLRVIDKRVGAPVAAECFIDHTPVVEREPYVPVFANTLLMATVGTHAINASLYRKLPYHPVDDFTPIAMAASAPVAVVAGPSGSFTSLLDLIAQAKAKPGEISYGSAGNGTPGHLAGALFANAAGIRLTHIPYKGSAPAVTDLLGGQIPLMFDPLQSVQQHLAAGKLRALAVSSRSRARVQPAVPTIAEVAIPGFELTAWWAVFAPAKLPPELAQRLTDEIERIVASGDFEQKLGDLGVQPYVDKFVRDKTASLADFQKTEIAKWAKAVREAGITLD